MKIATFCKTLCAAVVLAGQAPVVQAAQRGPYLQNATKTSITIHWRSALPYVGMVRYGATQTSIDIDVIEAAEDTEHIVTITGLSPDTKYFYQVGDADGAALEVPADQDNQFFHSSPIGPRATRIWALGDAGTGTQDQADVRDAYLSLTAAEGKETNVVLALGDNAYNTGTDSEYGNSFFDVYQDLFRQAPIWATQGNHDQSFGVFADVFSHPAAGEAGGLASGSELYYSFDYGDIHFVCLGSYGGAIDNTAGAPQFQWLEQDLAANMKKWIIAFWHHPPFSYTDVHNADIESGQVRMRENAVEILENAGVDLVLTGHNHHYDRTKFIHGHYGMSDTFSDELHVVQAGDGDATPFNKTDNRGAVYVMAGSAGTYNTYTIIAKPVTHLAFDELGSFIVETNADNTEMTMRMLRENRRVDDVFRIVKPSPDTDADGVNDSLDNCLLHVNAEQRDTNADGYGNACDPDLNDDGIVNPTDLGLFRAAFLQSGPDLDADFNGDGVVNPIDLSTLRLFFLNAPGPSALVPFAGAASSGAWDR